MTQPCKKVHLRTRPNKAKDRLSYYLDFYPMYRDQSTMETVRHRSIDITIYANPKNQREKLYNEKMAEKAEMVRCRVYESIVNERYDIFDREKMKGDFLAYFKRLAAKRNKKWEQVYLYFTDFMHGTCTFADITVELCGKFREYLLTTRQLNHRSQRLHVNTAANYWSTFRHALHIAYREKRIKDNPNGFLEKIELIDTDKEHLSQEELIRLAETPCDTPELRRAFLFACLTALRKSDIHKLTWEEIQPYGDGTMYFTTRMQKTKDIVHNPICQEALELIGYSPDKRGLVFPDFRDKMTQAPLRRWLEAAGVTKKITFHCTRHTFACLQLGAGTNIKVVQGYLGHKNVTTTEVYAKICDEQKIKTMGVITLRRREGTTDSPTSQTEGAAR